MTRGPAGYGRYDDDPEHVGCPRARSSESPCIVRDGALALADNNDCVMCGQPPRALLRALGKEMGHDVAYNAYSTPGAWADALKGAVYTATRPDLPAEIRIEPTPIGGSEPHFPRAPEPEDRSGRLMSWSSDFTKAVPTLSLPVGNNGEVGVFEPDQAAVAHHVLGEFLRDCAVHRRAPGSIQNQVGPVEPLDRPDWGHGPNTPVKMYTEDEIRAAAAAALGGTSGTEQLIDALLQRRAANRTH